MIKKCSDCGSELEEGCIIDHTYGQIIAQRYSKAKLSDKPQAKLNFSQYETIFNDTRRILAYRCTNCNKVSLYTQDFILNSDLKKEQGRLMLWIFGITLVAILLSWMFLF